MRSIVLYNNPILHRMANQVISVDDSLRQLVNEMFLIMKNAGGIGLAGPQIGESLQVAVVDVPPDMGGRGKVVLINPRIVSAYGNEIAEEGCLSLPGVQIKVRRYKEVTIETLDLNGKNLTYKATGLESRAIQHEIDHLNGILIIDKLGPLKRLLVKRDIRRRV